MKYVTLYNGDLYTPVYVGGTEGDYLIEYCSNPVSMTITIQMNGTAYASSAIQVDGISYTTNASGQITLVGESGSTVSHYFHINNFCNVTQSITHTANGTATVNVTSPTVNVTVTNSTSTWLNKYYYNAGASVTYLDASGVSQTFEFVPYREQMGEGNGSSSALPTSQTFTILARGHIIFRNLMLNNKLKIKQGSTTVAHIESGDYGAGAWMPASILTSDTTYTLERGDIHDTDCDCDTNCSDCCVAEGTLIICYKDNKYILVPVEQVQAGDIVVGANGQLNEVYARTDTVLGKERTMFTFEDNSLYFTGEHSIWVRYKDEEYFGIHDISGYYREKTATVNGQPILEWEQEKTYRENGIVGKPISKGLSREPIFVLFDAEYGTDKGWKHNQAIIAKDKVYPNNTPIHTLIVGGNHTFFGNGYLLSGFATDEDYDYNQVEIKDLEINIAE